MSEERILTWNLQAEIDRYFDESSVPKDGEPEIVIFMGGPAAGKTMIRKRDYATGYVLVDAAEIFLSLSQGVYFPFPGELEQFMEFIGAKVAQRAVAERRNIVTEVIGAEVEPMRRLINAMRAAGYRVSVQAIQCSIEVAQQRNISRGDDNVSAYYAEKYQHRWLLDAVGASEGRGVTGVRKWLLKLPFFRGLERKVRQRSTARDDTK